LRHEVLVQLELARSHYNLGNLLRDTGRPKESERPPLVWSRAMAEPQRTLSLLKKSTLVKGIDLMVEPRRTSLLPRAKVATAK
jgi:hypothetical protein